MATSRSSSTASPAIGCDTRDMLVIHGFFRHVFRDAPDLVRGVATGDVARARVVGAHVREVAQVLHHHHRTEDDLLWDELERRSPACALHVGVMRAQHAEAARLIGELELLVPAWEAAAGAAERDAVAGAVEALRAAVDVHLGAEEQRILPVAGEAFTQAEWDRLGEHGRAAVPKDRRLVQLGWMIESMGPDAGAAFVRRALPPPVRLLWRVVGRRKFAAHRAQVYGTA